MNNDVEEAADNCSEDPHERAGDGQWHIEGVFLGWRLTILTILIGALTGSAAGIVMMSRRGGRDLQMMLPFGIFLGIGAIVSLLFGSSIIHWYASQFQ